MSTEGRRTGVDLARWVAFVGMVFVNFGIVMRGPDGAGDTMWMAEFVDALAGRAASLFVVLAGLGLGWTARRSSRAIVVKRGLFLFVLGLANATIFSGDILHFYGVWFVIGAFVMRWRVPVLLAVAGAVVVASALMILSLDYDAGWNWPTLEYTDFWTASGMLRHMFFNGWHPVFPWFAFLLLGLSIAHLDLARTKTLSWLILGGATVSVAAQWLSHELVANFTPELGAAAAQAVFGTSSIPPMPLYVLAASGSSVAVLGLCLVVADIVPWLAAALAPAGRQTLTLYLGHIVIGMGCLEVMGVVGNQTVDHAVYAAGIFCLVATVAAWLWSKRFAKGPLEAVMRKCTG